MKLSKLKEDYEHRRVMWSFLSKLFYEVDPTEFMWMFSENDRIVVNEYIGGIAGCCRGAV